ncbi:hypothetical protein FRC09_009839, partial [Ceratobasidium sp. 395]
MATTDGEIDTCRICSAPAEEGQPLFYPCKCSGTIRYIHQDCLTTWLAHSKKRSCDVCKYEYSFTKVYKADMPKRLPPKLFLKKLSTQMARVVIMSLRLVMISVIWLAMLPYLTLLVWRFYFWTGEALAYWVVGQELPDRSPTPPQQLNTTNASQPPADNSTLAPLPPSEHTWLNVLPQDLGADIFKGQVITIAVVIVFLTIFLLREWIIQNARPGVFGDEEALEGGAAAPEGALPEVAEEMPALVEVDANPVPPRINNPIMDAAPDIAADFEEDEEIGDQSAGVVPSLGEREDAALPLDPDPEEEWEDESSDTSSEPTYARNEGESSRSTQGKGKERDVDESAGMLFQTGSEQTTIQASRTTQPASPVVESATLVPPSEPAAQDPELKDVATSKVSFELENDLSLPSSFAFSSPTGASQSLTHSIESSLDGTRPPSSYISSSSSTVATESQIQSSVANFPFTFTLPVAESATDVSQTDSQPAPTPGPFPTFFGTSGASTSRSSLAPPSPNRAAPTPLPFPLTPQPVAGPSGIRRATKMSRPKIPPKHMSASTPAFDRNTTEFDEFRFSFSSTPTTLSQSSSRHSSRPPLPPSTPGVDEPLPSATVSGTSSPGLALYRPPEDLSNGLGYFDRGAVAKASAQELEAMFNPQPEQRPDSEPRDSNTVVGEPAADEPIVPEPELDEEVVAQAVGDFVQAIAQPRGVPLAPVLQEEDDVEEEVQDVEPMGDDDMDGALEAIAVGVWMPFTMGKTTALLF